MMILKHAIITCHHFDMSEVKDEKKPSVARPAWPVYNKLVKEKSYWTDDKKRRYYDGMIRLVFVAIQAETHF
jgi:hypothetical protein